MNTRIPVDPRYVQAIGEAVYCFAYYEWMVIYIIQRLKPGFVAEFSRSKKMTSGMVSQRFKRVLRESTEMTAMEGIDIATCHKDFDALVGRRNALIHAHPITESSTGAQILNFQGIVSQDIADMKWDREAVDSFVKDVGSASIRAGKLFGQLEPPAH